MAEDLTGLLVGQYQPRPSFFTGNRNQAKVESLRRLLGLDTEKGQDPLDYSQQELEQAANDVIYEPMREKYQAEAQKALIPEQLKGQYGLAEAELKGRYGVEAARAKAQQDAERLGQTQAFQAGQGELNRKSRADLQSALQAEISARAAAQQQTQKDIQGMPLRPKAPTPSGGWHPLGNLYDWLFGGAETQPVAPTAATGRLTRPLKNGGTAYSDDGGKTWFTE